MLTVPPERARESNHLQRFDDFHDLGLVGESEARHTQTADGRHDDGRIDLRVVGPPVQAFADVSATIKSYGPPR